MNICTRKSSPYHKSYGEIHILPHSLIQNKSAEFYRETAPEALFIAFTLCPTCNSIGSKVMKFKVK